MKKQFQQLQALLGASRVLSRGRGSLRASPALIAGVFALAVLLVARAQDAATSPPGPIEGATNAVAPAASTPSLPDPPSPSPSPAQTTPALPEPTPPPLGDIVQPPPAPLPSANETILEAQPVVPASSGPTAGADASPASPFAAPVSVQPTPALRASDVDFPSPPARNQSEPLVAIGRPASKTDYGQQGNSRAAQLRTMPPERFTFDRASLRDVLRFLAEAAGIPYIGIPEHSKQAQQLVTFRMTASPFAALESVARQNDIKLTFDEGVWFMRLRDANVDRTLKVEDENELVGVVYQLRNDPGDRVAFGTEGMSGTTYQGAGSMGGPTGQSMQQGFGGTGQSGPASPQLPLQNSQYVFTTRAPKIVNDIRIMLGLKPLVYHEDGTVDDPDAGGGSQASRLPIPPYDGSQPSGLGQRSSSGGSAPAEQTSGLAALISGGSVSSGESGTTENASGEVGKVLPVYIPPQKPQVIYNADNNLIWVVATRKQHRWVAEYLMQVDQPQELIAIEVKFVETKKNPQYDFGINWGNMLGTGITVRGSANAGIGGEYGFGFGRTNEWGSTSTSSSGSSSSILNAINSAIINNQTNLTITDIINRSSTGNISGGNFSTNFNSSGRRSANIDFRGQNTAIPYEAVLSLDEVSVTLQAFMQDRDTSVVQYPRVLTINNREVAITSAENTPVNAGVSQTQSGTTATQTGTLGYLPIGTQINILPKVVGSNKIALSVAVTISSIVGTVPINLGTGLNEYPITTERVYNATLQVDSGYTLAVGGLEKVDDRDVQGGVPVLKDIPGLGQFFKNKNKARNRTNLIIFMTPYIISDVARNPGVSETPVSIVPTRPGAPPEAPVFTPAGRLSGGENGIAGAFAWLEFQLRYFRQITEENMTNLDSIEKLKGVISVARALVADLQLSAGAPPYSVETQAGRNALRAEELLADLNRALASAQEDVF